MKMALSADDREQETSILWMGEGLERDCEVEMRPWALLMHPMKEI